jgi:hypothetical protein
MMNTNELLTKLPPFKGQKVTVTEKQSVPRIMKEIVVAHNEYAGDYDKIAEYFYTGDDYSTEKMLFDFCKDNFTYSIESDKLQTVRSPTAILVLGEIRGLDCKHYASFIGGVLSALNRTGRTNFNWFYRFASYSPTDKIPEHVYVVVKDNGLETWIDPVLRNFDDRIPYPIFIEDIKPKKMALVRLSGINGGAHISAVPGLRSTNYARAGSERAGCGSVRPGARVGCAGRGAIGTVSSTGKMIAAISPSLAVIPVVGWVAAVGGELIGTFLTIFGSHYSTSTNVRWLVQKYEKQVLGIASATSDNNVSEAYTASAQKWFSYIMGVPIYDQLRYHALRGTSPVNGQSLGLTRNQRAQNYLQSAPDAVQGGYTLQDALAATYQADQFIEPSAPGSWKNFTVAPALIQAEQTQQQNALAASGPAGAVQVFAQRNPIILLGGAAVLAYLILK